MNLGEPVERVRVYWIATSFAVLGFISGFGTYVAIKEAAGLRTIREGTYILKDELEGKYLPRTLVDREYVLRTSLPSPLITQEALARLYIPRDVVERDFISLASAGERFISLEECTRRSANAPLTGTTEAPRATLPAGAPTVPSPTGSPIFETESYRATVTSVHRQGTALRITVLFESLSDSAIELAWEGLGRTYLLDENGERWALDGRDSGGIIKQIGGLP